MCKSMGYVRELKSARRTLGAGIKPGQVPLFSELQGEFADRYEFTISLILTTAEGLRQCLGFH